MKRIILFSLLLLASVIVLYQFDDKLSPESEKLLNKTKTSETSLSYIYLLGMDANENEDPLIVGREKLEAHEKMQANDAYKTFHYDESKKLAIPKGDLFCKIKNDDCLKQLFETNFDIKNIISENKTLISRVSVFYDFNEFKTLAKPSLEEPLPLPYQYIESAARINILNAISLYKSGETDEAVTVLKNQIQTLRTAMQLQDDLVGRLVFLSYISNTIDTLSIILTKSNLKSDSISPLTPLEKDFSLISAREFASIYATLEKLDKNPELFQARGKLPGWVVRLFYKPNMTANAIAAQYLNSIHMSTLSPEDFYSQVKTNTTQNSISKLRNYAGNEFIVLATIDEYVARFMDLDRKVYLFNQLHQNQKHRSDAQSTHNNKEYIEVLDDRICYRDSLGTPNDTRCLRTKY